MIYRSPNSIGSLFFNCPIRRTVTVKTHNIYKKTAWCITRIILRPLSALSLDEVIAKHNITTGLLGLHGARRLKYKCVEITECKLYMRVGDTKIISRVGENRRT